MPIVAVRYRVLELKKKFPLSISRGTSTGSKNLFVEVEDQNGKVGIGECAPGTGFDETLAALAQSQLEALVADGISMMGIQRVYAKARAAGVNPSAIAALDMALWDLMGKRSVMPLYRLLGLWSQAPITSVTIGINTPEVTTIRVPEILEYMGGYSLKIKLGSPDGIEHDMAHYEAARGAAKPFNVSLRVDANGGWSVGDAKKMMAWLAERDCEYVEQPLARGEEAGLPELYEGRPLPLFVDESVHFSTDVPPIAHCVDGVNLKLMKCGGITEALRIVAVCRAFGLQTMIGCMGESSISISAGAAIGELFDYIDLDSHLNLDPDPASGAKMVAGVVTPPEAPGHGAFLLQS